MLATCLFVVPTEEQKLLMDKPYSNSDFHISKGKNYIVYGLAFEQNENGSNICFIQILSDYGHLIQAPIFLFDIVDRRVSKYWELKIFPDGSVTLWPPSFYKEFYHDDLFEEIEEVVKDFQKVSKNIEIEFS